MRRAERQSEKGERKKGKMGEVDRVRSFLFDREIE